MFFSFRWEWGFSVEKKRGALSPQPAGVVVQAVTLCLMTCGQGRLAGLLGSVTQSHPVMSGFPLHAAVSQPKQFLHPWLLCLSAVQRCDVALPKCLCSGVCVPFSVCVSWHIIIVLLSKRTFYDPYPLYATYLLAGTTV